MKKARSLPHRSSHARAHAMIHLDFATAAQAINRDLFEESLRNHSLRLFRELQLKQEEAAPQGA